MKYALSAFFFLAILGLGHGQGLRFGLKAGMHYGGVDGPLESIETTEFSTGFNIAITASYPITDVIGLKAELQYLQINSDQFIDGASYLRIRDLEDRPMFVAGFRDQNLAISRSYIYLPVSVYGLFLEKIELYGGMQVGLLVSQRAAGEVGFSRVDGGPELFRVGLDYNYGKDEALQFASAETVETSTGFVHEQLGAYYEYPSVSGKLFETIDLGVHAGIAYYINPGLYLNARASYGLLDITNNKVDRQYGSWSDDQFDYSSDHDRNVFLELGLGFKI